MKEEIYKLENSKNGMMLPGNLRVAGCFSFFRFSGGGF